MRKRNLFIICAALVLSFGTYIGATTYNAPLIVSGLFTASGHTVIEGVTSTGATGSGKMVYDGTPTIANAILTAPALGTPASGVMTNVTSIPGAQITGTIGNGQYYGLAATAYVATQQSTTSLTDVDLATADTVTFTLAATSNLLIQYTAQTFNSNAGKGCTSEFYFDTVDASIYANQQQGATGSTPQAVTGQYVKTGVAAGSHTVNVKHRVEVNTCNWLFRNISVFTTP